MSASNVAILGQVGLTVAVPIALGAWLGQKLDERVGSAPWGLLGLTFVGMAVAGLGVAMLIRRYLSSNPAVPVSDAARQAGRRWAAEIEARDAKRRSGEE